MTERERDIHPDLKDALEREVPEIYIDLELFWALEPNCGLEEDFDLLKLGFRISPKGLRSFIFGAVNGYCDEEGWHRPFDFYQRTSAIMYAFMTDLINEEEMGSLLQGKAIWGNFMEKYEDYYIGPNNIVLGNRVAPTLEEVAIDIERKRSKNPNLKVVLLHGKWNGIPHAGHILASRNITGVINTAHGIKSEDMVVVVACDQNDEIFQQWSTPFLNTFWRLSMISYLPWVDYVCPSGSFNFENVNAHWHHKYLILRPDFVQLDPESEIYENKAKQVRSIGAIPIGLRRQSEWVPELGNPLGYKIDKPITSANIREENVDSWAFEREYNRILVVKQLRDQMYGPRDLFSHPNVLRIDKNRGLQAPSIDLIKNSRQGSLLMNQPNWEIIKPTQKKDPRERVLRSALSSVGV